jgi:membrane protein
MLGVSHCQMKRPVTHFSRERWMAGTLPPRDVWLGAALTALLFSLCKHLISLYIGSSNMASTYGAASALIIIFVWVYYSAQIFLLGAEFAKVHGDSLGGGMRVRRFFF